MVNKERGLYFLILVLLCGMVLVALGGGPFDQLGPWQVQWQHQAFLPLCHQMPSRSFWINGQPMAVCSRCFGIYVSFLCGWLLLPVYAKWELGTITIRQQIVWASLLINVLDVVGNVLGFWENTLVSRFVLGSVLGMSTTLIFSGDFFNITIKSMGNHHGRITTADR